MAVKMSEASVDAMKEQRFSSGKGLILDREEDVNRNRTYYVRIIRRVSASQDEVIGQFGPYATSGEAETVFNLIMEAR